MSEGGEQTTTVRHRLTASGSRRWPVLEFWDIINSLPLRVKLRNASEPQGQEAFGALFEWV